MTRTFEQALSDRRRVLGNPYAYLAEKEEAADLRASRRISENPYAHDDELARLTRPVLRFDGLAVEASSKKGLRPKRWTDAEIQQAAREALAQIWENRSALFDDFATRTPIDMIDPRAALALRGFRVEIVGALGQIAGTGRHVSNVAGLIDKASKQVLIASGLSPASRSFTMAHELGHAAMHDMVGMHRDKAMDGSTVSSDPQEREAEKFAAYFLMPGKLVSRTFEEIFGRSPFVLDEDSRFALAGSLPSSNWSPRTVRDLSRLLASAERFNGLSMRSLAEQFRVSREAMAIRLEQLRLVALRRR